MKSPTLLHIYAEEDEVLACRFRRPASSSRWAECMSWFWWRRGGGGWAMLDVQRRQCARNYVADATVETRHTYDLAPTPPAVAV
jgi:hypothetical protein